MALSRVFNLYIIYCINYIKLIRFIVACQSGTRSVIAVKLLQDMGYNPINLAGGFNAWETFEFEVEMP